MFESALAVLNLSVMSDSLRPHGLDLLRSSVHGDSPDKNTGGGCHALPSPGDLPNPGIEPRSPQFQADIVHYASLRYLIGYFT